MEMAHLEILLRHGPLGLVFLFRSVTQGYTLGWDTDQPFGLSESVTSAVAESLFKAQRQYCGSIQTYKLFFNTDLATEGSGGVFGCESDADSSVANAPSE